MARRYLAASAMLLTAIVAISFNLADAKPSNNAKQSVVAQVNLGAIGTLIAKRALDVRNHVPVRFESLQAAFSPMVPVGTGSPGSSWMQVLAGFGLIVFTALRRS